METILDIDPGDRIIIKVGDYSEIKSIDSKKQSNIEKIKKASKAAGIGVGGRLVGRAALTLISPIGAALLVSATDIMSINKLLQSKGTDGFSYVEVPINHASSFLKWKGIISPEKNTFYIKSPHNDAVYIPAAKFHTILFEEKYNEAIALLTELKPKSLLVECMEGYSKEIKTKAGFQKDGINVNADFEKDSRVERKNMYRGEYKKPETLERHVVSSEYIWYQSETLWQKVVDGVIRHGLEQVEMDIIYDNDFGVNADLELSLAKVAGGNIAVKFASFKKTRWKVKATFW
ncbi:hypothetical protein [Paenibacillus piscarius]|uniref:hypothetical protein n=1 Tax=Paenibacillus piscarius TaxID=1089681 RepID=UPI001EE91A93|nr:hypothetical protein [Paenibacillus piscarius]